MISRIQCFADAPRSGGACGGPPKNIHCLLPFACDRSACCALHKRPSITFALLAGYSSGVRACVFREGMVVQQETPLAEKPPSAEQKPLKLQPTPLADTRRAQQKSLSVKASFRSIHGPLKTSCTTVSSP